MINHLFIISLFDIICKRQQLLIQLLSSMKNLLQLTKNSSIQKRNTIHELYVNTFITCNWYDEVRNLSSGNKVVCKGKKKKSEETCTMTNWSTGACNSKFLFFSFISFLLLFFFFVSLFLYLKSSQVCFLLKVTFTPNFFCKENLCEKSIWKYICTIQDYRTIQTNKYIYIYIMQNE